MIGVISNCYIRDKCWSVCGVNIDCRGLSGALILCTGLYYEEGLSVGWFRLF